MAQLTIKGYTDATFSGTPVEYTVQVNPEKYSIDYTVHYDTCGALGSANTPPKFQRALPAKMHFELLFDGTGVIDSAPPPSPALQPFDVATELQKFRDVVFTYNGVVHEPNYLQLVWGATLFPARLTSLSENYTLFNPEGAPLRAKVNVSFDNAVDQSTIDELEDQQSPDVTHLVRVRAGDTLPLLSARVYGSPRHYLRVARFNHLVNFRQLKPGQLLKFPPLN